MFLATYRTKPHIVYWAYLSSFADPFSEGYIGVTTLKLESRAALHFSGPTSPALQEEIAKNRKDILWRALHTDLPRHAAYRIERLYRPERYIGWNAGRGGRRFKDTHEEWFVTRKGIYRRRY